MLGPAHRTATSLVESSDGYPASNRSRILQRIAQVAGICNKLCAMGHGDLRFSQHIQLLVDSGNCCFGWFIWHLVNLGCQKCLTLLEGAVSIPCHLSQADLLLAPSSSQQLEYSRQIPLRRPSYYCGFIAVQGRGENAGLPLNTAIRVSIYR